jgi:hypothetical protein
MTIEHDSMEYETKKKQTAGISIDQFQQAVRHVVVAKARWSILMRLWRRL